MKIRDARAQITLTLKDEPLNGVIGLDTAQAVWEKLSARYEGKGTQKIAYLIGELFRSSLVDTEALEPQINKMRRTARTLTALKNEINDNLVAIAIILSLPSSYSTLQTILMSHDSQTTEDVIAKILSKESRRKEAAAQTAFLAKFRSTAKSGKDGSKEKKKRKKKCKNCDKQHAGECNKPKAEAKDEKAADKPKTEAVAKVAIAESSNDPPIQLFVADELAARKEMLFKWIIDSGASAPMSSHREWFTTYQKLNPPQKVWLGDDHYILAIGEGRVALSMDLGGHQLPAIVQKVLHVPEIQGNLLSVSSLTHNGLQVTFDPDNCCIYNRSGQLVGMAHAEGNLYILHAKAASYEQAYCATVIPGSSADAALTAKTEKVSKATAHTWHRRLGHINVNTVLEMVRKGLVKGMAIVKETNASPSQVCEPCLHGKQSRQPISKETANRKTTVLARIYSDVCGKMQVTSRTGYSYFATFIDDASRYLHVAFMKEKSEVLHHFKAFVERVEAETGARIQILRSDGGGEYTSQNFHAYLLAKGIQHEKTNAYTPEENGVAERMNRTLVESARSMLHDADLPNSYWADAVEYAAHIRNIVPTRALSGGIPYTKWSGNSPDLSRFHIFGCKAYVHVPDEKRRKLDSKTVQCVFIGYVANKKAYRCIDRRTGTVYES